MKTADTIKRLRRLQRKRNTKGNSRYNYIENKPFSNEPISIHLDKFQQKPLTVNPSTTRLIHVAHQPVKVKTTYFTAKSEI